MKYTILLIILLCVSTVSAIEFTLHDYKVTNKEGYRVVTYPSGELDILWWEPYVETVNKDVTIEGTREVRGIDFELLEPLELDINLPIVSGYDKDDMTFEQAYNCSEDIIADVELEKVIYKEGYTLAYLKYSPIEAVDCEYTFYQKAKVDFVFGDPLPTITHIDFAYPLRAGDNKLTIYFSEVPDGVISSDYFNISVSNNIENVTLRLDEYNDYINIDYLVDGEIISYYALSNMIEWGNFEFIVKKDEDATKLPVVIEVNNILNVSFPLEFEPSVQIDGDIVPLDNFSITVAPGINQYGHVFTVDGEIEGLLLEAMAFDYDEQAGHHTYLRYDSDIDTSEGLPETPLKKAIDKAKAETSKTSVQKSNLDYDIIAIIVVILVMIILGLLYYYYFVRK